MHVSEMVKNIKLECHPATNIDTFIKRSLNRAQSFISSKGPKGGWPWLKMYGFTLTTTSSVAAYSLSPLVDTSKIISFYDTTDPQFISNMSELEFRMREPGPTSTGTPYLYRLKGFSPVQNQPSSASVLALVSTSASDTAVDVTIQGFNSSNVLITESVTLTGTAPVSTTSSFTKILSISKDNKTVGTVSITSNSGAVANVSISPFERHITHPVIEFFTIPDSTMTLYYDFVLKLPNIYNDDDVSLIPEQYHDALELYAKHDVYKHLNNANMATLTFQELQARISDMRMDCASPAGILVMEDFHPDTEMIEARLPSMFPRGA